MTLGALYDAWVHIFCAIIGLLQLCVLDTQRLRSKANLSEVILLLTPLLLRFIMNLCVVFRLYGCSELKRAAHPRF